MPRKFNLLAQRKAPFLKPPADRPSAFLIVPNLVRGLVPSAPDQIWVADITYVHLARAFAYLAVILDAFSRKAVGWAFENTLDASLAIAALDFALDARKPQPGSRRAIRLHCLSPTTGRSRHHHQHEQARQSL
jgi:putative transposase